jgi:hypothetical protein
METMDEPRRPHRSPQSSVSLYLLPEKAAKVIVARQVPALLTIAASQRWIEDSTRPLALPLLRTLHGENPEELAYLSRTSEFFKTESESTLFDDIFAQGVNEWRKKRKREEFHLTRALAEAMEAKHLETHFHADGEAELKRPAVELMSTDTVKPHGRIDILLTPEEKASKTASTPFAIIEVGRNDSEWWEKLNQNIKYLANMGSQSPLTGCTS